MLNRNIIHYSKDLFPNRMKLSFEQWLEYKRGQEKRDSRESASDSESESESEKESRNGFQGYIMKSICDKNSQNFER